MKLQGNVQLRNQSCNTMLQVISNILNHQQIKNVKNYLKRKENESDHRGNYMVYK